MNEIAQKFPFPVDLLDSIVFPQKEADVLSDTEHNDTVNKEHQGETNAGKDIELQDLKSEGGDFSQNLESFLKAKKDDGKHVEKEEKANQLGFETQVQPEQKNG